MKKDCDKALECRCGDAPASWFLVTRAVGNQNAADFFVEKFRVGACCPKSVARGEMVHLDSVHGFSVADDGGVTIRGETWNESHFRDKVVKVDGKGEPIG